MNTHKKIVLANLVIILLFAGYSAISPQTKGKEKNISYPDVSGFFNSSHHWYDIFNEENVINALPDQPKYKASDVAGIADNILLYQKNNGGWPKNYDMLAILTDNQKDSLLKVKGVYNTTFDNWTTHSHVEYLAQAFAITKSVKYRDAGLKGIEFILAAQYPNGGWPQYYPLIDGYSRYITFNDGAFIGIMEVLQNIIEKKPYYSFVDDLLAARVQKAFDKGLDCILKCQIREEGKLNVWCQQHDNLDLKPQWARAFEPASICNGESAGIVEFLMSIKNPDKEIINSVQSAVKWFDESKISGVRVQTIPAPAVVYKWRKSSTDMVVVNDPDAPPIWTRFYELGTHKPLFCNRDSKVVYSLAEVDRERRDGYGWYTYDPQKVLDLYLDWQKKWAPGENVLR